MAPVLLWDGRGVPGSSMDPALASRSLSSELGRRETELVMECDDWGGLYSHDADCP